MLLGYGAKNYTCFREGVEISFRFSKNCPEKITRGRDVTNILCIKGANGSGKTNILKALYFVFDFCKASFQKKPEDNTGVVSFFNKNQPSEFFLDFIVDEVEYSYELIISDTEVISEILFRKNKRKTKLFERNYNELTENINDFENLKIIKLRSNASIISTANQYQICDELNKVYNFFHLASFNLNHEGLGSFSPNISDLSKAYLNNSSIFDFLKKIIISCDSGINNISIEEYEESDGEKSYRPVFFHMVDGKEKKLMFHSQSSGTKALYIQLGLYKVSLLTGGLLVLDEFDINFHPHILPFLLEIFLDKETNPDNSQLLFTTHNAEIMDFLTKYRTYLVNKEDNESYVYRLDEISGDILRNDRSIAPIYNSGKIGGIPKI